MLRLSKVFSLQIVIVVLLFFTGCTNQSKKYQFYESSSEKSLSLKEIAKELVNYNVVFFGEFHDDSLIHSIESEILPILFKQKKDLTISMEMFERDIQNILDDFLANKIKENNFIEDSRAWPNYLTDYKNIIEFAKTNNLDVIASNVPRKYAAMVSKQGAMALENLSQNEKKYVAENISILDNEYKKNFVRIMEENMKMGKMKSRNMPISMMKGFDNIYVAQCLKDDTMAESIFQYLNTNPETLVIHYNGNFHSEYHLGTANKLKRLNKNLKIAVISPIYANDITIDSKDKRKGDYLLYIVK